MKTVVPLLICSYSHVLDCGHNAQPSEAINYLDTAVPRLSIHGTAMSEIGEDGSVQKWTLVKFRAKTHKLHVPEHANQLQLRPSRRLMLRQCLRQLHARADVPLVGIRLHPHRPPRLSSLRYCQRRARALRAPCTGSSSRSVPPMSTTKMDSLRTPSRSSTKMRTHLSTAPITNTTHAVDCQKRRPRSQHEPSSRDNKMRIHRSSWEDWLGDLVARVFEPVTK